MTSVEQSKNSSGSGPSSVRRRRSSWLTKRAFDLVAVGVTIPFWVPLVLVLALVVRWRLGSPVFFRQQRPGRGERVFSLIKFRTMKDTRGVDGNLLSDAERLTAFGRFLRGSSLDELPELWNVLKGEMSLVGPRPLLVHYLPRYNALQRRRHEVPPGVTGWAQINGRNALSWDEKFALDVWYVEHRTFWLDLRILFLTLWKVVARQGISAPGDATMPEFFPPNSTPTRES
ncbi:MAG: sugar transferase [Candidatus Didemnitutus sp.]|nr:sugar transferase [Candidatus Didemnitutus sp.]